MQESRLLQLFTAVEKQNVEEVRTLISQLGGYVNKKIENKNDYIGRAPLHVAAKIGNIEILKLFINAKDVDLNIKQDYEFYTPLHLAAEAGNNEVLKILVGTGRVDVNFKVQEHCYISEDADNFIEFTALDYVLNDKNFDGARILIDAGAKYYDKGALSLAVKYNDASFAEYLISRGASVNKSLPFGFTPLHSAAKCNKGDSHFAVIKVLLEKGADANTRRIDNFDRTPFDDLVRKAGVKTVQLFLDFGANVHAKNYYGETPLIEAVKARNFEVVKLLINKGADANAVTSSGETLLFIAAKSGSVKVAQLFLDRGADVNVTNYSGENALYKAAEGKKVEMVQFLLDQGSDVNAKNGMSESALFSAVRGQNYKTVQLLLDRGADVNIINERGENPLFYAAKGESYEVVQLLLDRGADANVKNLQGENPLFDAVQRGRVEIVQLLLDHGSDVNIKNSSGENVLFSAIEARNFEILQLLLGHGSDVNCTCENKKTPLHWAARSSENSNMLKCLLKKGADVNAIDSEGQSPLLILLSRGLWYDSSFEKTLKFMLRYSNFTSIDQNRKKNFFDCWDERKWKIILAHIAKLTQEFDISIHPSIIEIILNKTEYNDYFVRCTDELNLAKKTKIEGCWVTFFNVLTDNKRKLKNYAGNDTLIQEFEKSDYVENYPIYGSSMLEKLEKGKKRRKLFDESSVELSNRLPIFNPDHLIIRDIFDCLSTKDLAKFCE